MYLMKKLTSLNGASILSLVKYYASMIHSNEVTTNKEAVYLTKKLTILNTNGASDLSIDCVSTIHSNKVTIKEHAEYLMKKITSRNSNALCNSTTGYFVTELQPNKTTINCQAVYLM